MDIGFWDIGYWPGFIGVVFVASIIPGPSTLIAFEHGAVHGASRSVATAAGNCVASALQATAASAGLGLVITSSAVLFEIVKYAGALYLIYVGLQMWRSAAHRLSAAGDTGSAGGWWRLFSGGFLVAASNPKAIAFFTALFPQFLSADGDSLPRLTSMVAVVGVIAFAVAFLYGLAGAWLKALDLSRRFMRRGYRVTGGLLVASGIGLVVARD